MAKSSGSTRARSRAISTNDMLTREVRGATLVVGDVPNGYTALNRGNTIYISASANEAIERLLRGEGNESDALKLEELLHEINHIRANRGEIVQIKGNYGLEEGSSWMDSYTRAMEVMNEIRSRSELPAFASRYGITLPSVDYSRRGERGYNKQLGALDSVIKALGADKDKVYREISTSREQSANALARILRRNSKVKLTNATSRDIVRNTFGGRQQWERDKEAAIVDRYTIIGNPTPKQAREAIARYYGTGSPNITAPYSLDVALEIIRKLR